MTNIKIFLILFLFGFSLNNHAVCMNNNNNNKKRNLDNDNNSEQQDNAKKTKEFDDQKSLELLDECTKYNTSLETIETLLEQNADPNSKDDDDWTPLYLVCYNNDPSHNIIELLLKYNADPNSKNNNWAPLHHVCYNNNTSHDIIELLLKYNADPNSKNDYNWTPLHLVCYKNNPSHDIIELLLKYNADPNSKDDDDWTPLHLVCKNERHFDAIKLIIFHFFGYNLNDFPEMLKNLSGRNPELKNTIFTCLLCLNDLQKNFKLTQKGANPFIVPKFIKFEFFKYLIFALIAPVVHNIINTQNNKKQTALMIAQSHNLEQVVLFLQGLKEALNNGWDALFGFWQKHFPIEKK